MKNICKMLLAGLILLSVNTFAQEDTHVFKGDEFFNGFNFNKALYFYQMAYDQDDTDPIVTRKIANTHQKMGNLEKAAEWYAKTLELDNSNAEDMLYYAEALKSLMRYDEAVNLYEKYNTIYPNDIRAKSHVQDKKYYRDLLTDSLKYRMRKLDVNSDRPAFGISHFENDMYLFSASGVNPESEMKGKSHGSSPYLDIYMCEKNINKEFVMARKLPKTVNSKYHDGPVFYDKNSKTIYITRNNIEKGKPVLDKTGNANLKIYTSEYNGDNEWLEVDELSFNSDEYSTGHPCLSKNGDFLYFVSNMPGGHGGTDIYRCRKESEGWSEPMNLGSSVNTENDEMFPYVSEEGILYFASDGHAGLGGLDIFTSEPWGDSWSRAYNLGYPINSNHDDFSLLFEPGDENGFFTSNREGKGSDDIYFFSTLELMEQILAGTIRGNNSNESLAGEKILVDFANRNKTEEAVLDENESFELLVKPGDIIDIRMASKEFDNEKPIFSYTTPNKLKDPYIQLGMNDVALIEIKAPSQIDSELEKSLASGTAASITDKELADKLRTDMQDLKDNLEEISNMDVSEAKNLNADDFDLTEVQEPKTNNLAEANEQKSMEESNSMSSSYSNNSSKSKTSITAESDKITFVFDKSYIGISAASRLDALVEEMKQNPQSTLEIDAHCDSRGSDSYNDQLSQARAKEMKKYLVWKGIKRDRIAINWHGEEDLVNNCSDDVVCSSAAHEDNRRAEFRLISENMALAKD